MDFTNYTKAEIESLVAWIHHGAMITESVAELRDDPWQPIFALEQKLFQSIYDAGHIDIITKFEDTLLPTDKLLKQCEDALEEYNEAEFWEALMIQMGKRDFFRSMTEKEKQALEEDGWLPERIQELYQKYDDEFSERGLERLEIQQS
jgi:hypothetical protein